MPGCVYKSMCVRMSVYAYIISLTSMCTSERLCVCVHPCVSVCEYAYVVMSRCMCVYTFGSSPLCVMFVHCLVRCDTESA